MTDDLSPKERAVLLSLLLHGPVLSNSAKEPFRLDVGPKVRQRLNALGLVVSVRKTAYQHMLTESGRKWCMDELATGSARAGDNLFERTFYSLLGVVRGKVDLPSIVEGASLPGQLDEKQLELALRAAYKDLRSESRGWVSVADLLTALWSGYPRKAPRINAPT